MIKEVQTQVKIEAKSGNTIALQGSYSSVFLMGVDSLNASFHSPFPMAMSHITRDKQ